MTDRPKSIAEALAEVQRKVNEQRAERLNNMIEAIGPAVAYRKGEGATGVALAGQGIGLENRRNQDFVKQTLGDKYDPKIHKAGSAASNLALLAHAKSQQQAAPAPTGSQSAAGNGDVQKGVTAAPVAPASSGEKGIAAADAIAGTDRAIEKNSSAGTSSQLAGKPLEADGSNATPAQFINANRAAGAAGGTTMGSARQFGTIAAAGDAGKAGDDSARSSMSTDQKAKIDSDAASRQADMNAEREKNIAAQAAKREAPAPTPAASTSQDSATRSADMNRQSDSTEIRDVGNRLGGGNRTPSRPAPAPSSDSPSMFSKVKDFFTKPTETKVGDNGIEPESGPKGKKKMSESALIDAFLKLQETNHPNIFEAAKKAKKDYDGDGKVESGKDEYLGSRIAAAKKAGKMEEELKGNQKKIDANNNGKIDGDDFRKLRSGKKSEKMKAYRADRDKNGEMEEETFPGFSEAELAHFAAIFEDETEKPKAVSCSQCGKGFNGTGLKSPYKTGFSHCKDHKGIKIISEGAAPVDQGKADQRKLRGTSTSRGIGDTVPNRDLTDEFEYIDEMARGVKAGQKRGSYKGKAHKGGADAKGASMPDEEPKGVPHVLDQIRHGHEDEQGFKTITHPASSPEAPVTKRIHRSELHGFYDQYHNTEKPAAKEKAYGAFLGKHFGDERATAPTSKSVTTDLSKVEKANLKGGAGKVSLGGSKLVGGKK